MEYDNWKQQTPEYDDKYTDFGKCTECGKSLKDDSRFCSYACEKEYSQNINIVCCICGIEYTPSDLDECFNVCETDECWEKYIKQ